LQPTLYLTNRNLVAHDRLSDFHRESRCDAHGICPAIALEGRQSKSARFKQRVGCDFDGVLHTSAVDEADQATLDHGRAP